jgi:hypothetical protein
MTVPYTDRLALARRGLAALHRTSPTPPGHVIDQLEAARTPRRSPRSDESATSSSKIR